MLTLPNCHVETQDGVFPDIDGDGRIAVFGEFPTATVRLSIPDYEKKKFVIVDTLDNATMQRKGDTWTFTGTSAHLTDAIGAADPTLSFSATPAPGCEACRQ